MAARNCWMAPASGRGAPLLWGWVAAALVAPALATGCATEADFAPADSAPYAQDTGTLEDGAIEQPQAEVGGASEEGTDFVDWSSGSAEPAITRGPQGGQHIWVSAHIRHVFPNKIRVAVTMYLEETATSIEVKPGRVEMTGNLKADGDWLIYPGIAAFVKEPCKIKDRKVRVELDVDDLYGRKVQAKAWIRPTWDGVCTQ